MTETPQECFERVNAHRVKKIMEFMDMIDKSAASNRVDPKSIMGPVRDRLMDVPMQLPPGVMPEPAPTASHWNKVVEVARTAPLADAVVALQIIATRIEQELHDVTH